jgi:glycosyltransferase involved in cell wall biosynthesis
MDDCSPDNTAAVARSFKDPRVKHIRNNPNLGHLRNYNHGIKLSRGKYVWLISADDYLKQPYVLERYIECLENHSDVGYVFCSGFSVVDGVETETVGSYRANQDRDCIIEGKVLLKRLLRANFILAASGLVRRDCYEKISLFPVDMPWAGDWYLWSLYACFYKVGYFAEPMVCYRRHNLSMTTALMRKSAAACCEEDVGVVWAVKNRADDAGLRDVSELCLDALGEIYARNIATRRYNMSGPALSFEEFEESLSKNCIREEERLHVLACTYAGMGNEYYWQGEGSQARAYYKRALKIRPGLGQVRLKLALLSLGKVGGFVRKTLLSARN